MSHKRFSSLLPFFFFRHFSTKSIVPTAPKLKNIFSRCRPHALDEARLALIEYLHLTRSIPFPLSDQIVSNSPISLSSFLSLISFPSPADTSSFLSIIRKFLSYHPIDEFDFFSESIGLPPSIFPNDSIFLSDDPTLIEAVSVLVRFGFPFRKLGLMHEVLHEKEDKLRTRLKGLDELGFERACVIGTCLAFPWVLKTDLEGKVRFLFQDLKPLLLECGLKSNDINMAFDICRKVRVLYKNGAEIGRMGEILARNKRMFFEVNEDVLKRKLVFFSNLGVEKEKLGVFVLSHMHVFDSEFESLDVYVPEVLVDVLGLSEPEIERVQKIYPHVLGKNIVGNFPVILKALDLNKRFTDQMLNTDLHCLKVLNSKVTDKLCTDSDMMEEEFLRDMEVTKCRKKIKILDGKILFLSSIGFGKNKITSKAVSAIRGTREQLQERFDCIIGFGIKHSDVCRMISAYPIFINHSKEQIHKKLSYLCHELGYSIDYISKYPDYLCFDLENRIKPRYEIVNWLKGSGLVKKFSLATLLAKSERMFILYLYRIHHAAPKQWLEKYSSRHDHRGYHKSIFAQQRTKSTL